MNATEAITMAASLAYDHKLDGWKAECHHFNSRIGRLMPKLTKGSITLWWHDDEDKWSATHADCGGYLSRYDTPKAAMLGLVSWLTTQSYHATERAANAVHTLQELS